MDRKRAKKKQEAEERIRRAAELRAQEEEARAKEAQDRLDAHTAKRTKASGTRTTAPEFIPKGSWAQSVSLLKAVQQSDDPDSAVEANCAASSDAGGVGGSGSGDGAGDPVDDDDGTTLSQAKEDAKRTHNALLREYDDALDMEEEGFIPDNQTYIPNPYSDTQLQPPDHDNIRLTDNTLKWFERYMKHDSHFCEMFVKRIDQLARGERSRILQKRLTGSKHAIFETYLDMKVALRILWTECWENQKLSLLVWYVARHKDVSNKMDKISSALDRLNRQVKTTQEEYGAGGLVLQKDTVLLNPESNNPLKVFKMPTTDIFLLREPAYVPDLQMTGSERTIIEKEGTVCVLGQ